MLQAQALAGAREEHLVLPHQIPAPDDRKADLALGAEPPPARGLPTVERHPPALRRRPAQGQGCAGGRIPLHAVVSLDDLDGFYTFVVGTENGFGVLRDGIACKPAIMAETDRYVAFGSEYRALAGLPGIENARVWEPEPATVYFWER